MRKLSFFPEILGKNEHRKGFFSTDTKHCESPQRQTVREEEGGSS